MQIRIRNEAPREISGESNKGGRARKYSFFAVKAALVQEEDGGSIFHPIELTFEKLQDCKSPGLYDVDAEKIIYPTSNGRLGVSVRPEHLVPAKVQARAA